MTVIASQLQQLYVTYFNRPADVGGLAYWTSVVEQGTSLESIGASFAASGEFKTLYGGKPTSELIKAAYLNLFNRVAEPAGVDYWSDVIDKGRISAHEAVANIMRGANNTDEEYATNKVAAAVAFTTALDTPAKQAAYGDQKSLAVASAWLKGVTDMASRVKAEQDLVKVMDVLGGSNGYSDDAIAPTAKILSVAFDDALATLTFSGEDFDTLLGNDQPADTDVKANLDWSKLSLTIRGAGESAPAIGFALTDIVAVLRSDKKMAVELTQEKAAVITATTGYGGAEKELLKVAAGFLKDQAGNASISDATSLSLVATHSISLHDSTPVTPKTNANEVNLLVDAHNATVDASAITSYAVNISGGKPGDILTVTHLDNNNYLDASAYLGNVIASGNDVWTLIGGSGNDQLTSTMLGMTRFRGGGGADVITGRGQLTSVAYAAGGADFNASSVPSLIAAADTIVNWQKSYKQYAFSIGFDNTQLAVIAHEFAPTVGKASISPVGLATFAPMDSTLEAKLTAVVSTVGTDAIGTSVVFNDGGNAYIYVVGNSAAGVQEGDGLIRLADVTADGLSILSNQLIDNVHVPKRIGLSAQDSHIDGNEVLAQLTGAADALSLFSQGV